jgi:hypothetical protein
MRWLVALCVLAGCKAKQHKEPEPMPEPVAIADAKPIDAAAPWPELADYPKTAAERIISLPAQPDVPRLDVGGPVIAADVAVVSSSQFGFIAVDWRSGKIAWSKPAGERVAPPIAIDSGELAVVLIGDCTAPPVIPDGEALVGCVRLVTPTGSDLAYLAIRAQPKAIEAFAAARGPQAVWPVDDHTVRWRRGDAAIAIDLGSGFAKPADAAPPPLVVTYKDRRWDIVHDQGRIVARGKTPWSTQNTYSALLGTVWLPDQSPLLRIANLGAFRDVPELHIHDIDATGSLHGQFLHPVPGIAMLGFGVSSIGDAAIAVRLDASLRRDYVVGYAANALLMWVYPLPEVPRADPIGIALAPDAVVVFHDGDTVTILPELSAPPTTPGAARASSKNPTP